MDYKKKDNLLLFLFLMTISQVCLAQEAISDTLNRRNAKNKKDGLWLVYLDKNASIVDKEDACFYGYEMYDNGEWVMFFKANNNRKYKNIIFNGIKGETGNPLLLYGTFFFYDKKGRLIYEETYRDGMPLLLLSYGYDIEGVIIMKEILDYSKPYNNVQGTFFYEYYSFGELKSSGYFKKNGKSWKVTL